MEITVCVVPLSILSPHPKNAKLHPVSQIEKIAGSIRAYGFNNPILIDSEFTILAGHGRYQAAMLLKLKEVPTICLDHLSPEQARAYLIADNKVSESGFDVEILTDELFELSMDGFDGIALGFDNDEIEKLTHTANEADDIESEIRKIRVNTGEWWEVGRHKIYVGSQKVNVNHICERMNKSQEKLTLFLTHKQAQTIISRFEKAGSDIELVKEL